ncbi:MAG: FtsX-like permease family protein [Anaerolineae bacterium]|nr:FtsX-like permease family protein [Anaerolineae bacterium]
MNLQLTLAARYLRGRKLRTVLTTLAIIFGVVLIFGMNTVLPTMVTALQANVQGVEGQVDFTITHTSGEAFPADVVDKVKDLDGVRAVSVSLTRTVNLPADFVDGDPDKPDTLSAVNLIGIMPESARTVRAFNVIDGRYLEATDTDAALISQTLADVLSVGAGDTFSLPSTLGITELTVTGILPANIGPTNEEISVNLPQAQQMTNAPGKVNAIQVNVEAFADEERRAEIRESMEDALGNHYNVGALMVGDEAFFNMQMAQIMLSMFGALALFMGGFIIFNTFRTIVTERRRDIGMLRTIGAKRSTVIGIILAEGLLQGLIGSIVGLLFGYLLAAGVIEVAQGPLSQFINLSLGAPVISLPLVGISILLGVGTTVVAGLLPALNASRVTPMEALRPSTTEVDLDRQAGWGSIAGAFILIMTVIALLSGQAGLIIPGGLLFLVGLVLVAPVLVWPLANLFGRLVALLYIRQGIGGLARSSLTRQPSRVAVTASASMLCLAVIVAVGGLISSLTGSLGDMMENSLGSDYLLVPPSIGLWSSNVGANPELASQLRSIDGVDEVSTFRFAASTIDEQAVSVLGIEPVAFEKVGGLSFLEGSEAAYDDIANGRAMIANGIFMSTFGAKVGDTVELLTPEGEASYRIAAVAIDPLNAKITTAFISQANMQADFGSTEDVFIQFDLTKGADRKAVGVQIKALAADYPQFRLISGADYYQALESQMDIAFSAMYILFLFLAFPSLIAMLNTLAIGVLERTREIGMIRAVGGTRKQIRNMVIAEALLLAAIGTAFGLLGGLYLGYMLVTAIKVMFPMGYFFPMSGILTAIAIGLLFGVLAAVIPARQAARLEIVQALRYE